MAETEDDRTVIQQDDADNFTDIGEKHLDRGWAWVVMIAALLTHILTFGAAYASMGALYVEFLNDFGQSESATALTGSILLGTMLCAGPFASILVGRFGARTVSVIGGVLAVVGLVTSSFARGLIHLYFTFGFLTGLGYGLTYLPCIVMVGNFFERRRTCAGGIAVSGSGLGTFICAPITQSLLDTFGYRKALIILGGVELILCICGATYVPGKIPVRKIEVPRDDNESEVETGSILTASALESTSGVLTKPSDVSFLMQAAMCSSGLSFSAAQAAQPRLKASMARSSTPHDVGGNNSPMPQLSSSLATSSLLAQAALGTGGFSPSISSSVVSSSSKASEQHLGVRSPSVARSPIASIPEEWLESVAQAIRAKDNDSTLTAQRKPDNPPLPDEFTGGSTYTIKAPPDQESCATIVIPQGQNISTFRSEQEPNMIGARAIAAKVMEESAMELADSSCTKTASNCGSTKNISAIPIHLGASYSSNVSNKHDPSVYSSVDDVTIPDFPVDNINDLMIPTLQINGLLANPSGENDADENVDQYGDDISFNSGTTLQSQGPESKTVLEQMRTIASLFKNRFFVLFCICNLFVCIAYQLPYMYFKAFALSMGLGEDSWVLILSVMGIANTLGRVLVGFMFNYVYTDYGRLYGFAVSYMIAGVILTLTSLANSYVTLLCYATAFGFVAGSTDSLVAALLVGFVGLDALGYSFGMVIEMQGIGFVIGPPIAGYMYSLTGEYTAIFYTGGVAFVVSGLVLMLEPLISYIRKEHKEEVIELNRV